MKKTNKKGFTLAELLIVIAIIAVLIAIAIPTFAGALDNARRQTDHANIRAAYSIVQIAKLEGGLRVGVNTNLSSDGTYYFAKDGSITSNAGDAYILKTNGDGTCSDCAGCVAATPTAHLQGKKIIITVSGSGTNVTLSFDD